MGDDSSATRKKAFSSLKTNYLRPSKDYKDGKHHDFLAARSYSLKSDTGGPYFKKLQRNKSDSKHYGAAVKKTGVKNQCVSIMHKESYCAPYRIAGDIMLIPLSAICSHEDGSPAISSHDAWTQRAYVREEGAKRLLKPKETFVSTMLLGAEKHMRASVAEVIGEHTEHSGSKTEYNITEINANLDSSMIVGSYYYGGRRKMTIPDSYIVKTHRVLLMEHYPMPLDKMLIGKIYVMQDGDNILFLMMDHNRRVTSERLSLSAVIAEHNKNNPRENIATDFDTENKLAKLKKLKMLYWCMLLIVARIPQSAP